MNYFKPGKAKKALLLSASLGALAIGAPSAQAQDSNPWSLSANVALVTDYRFRGLSLSEKDPALQGGFDVAHESGFYIGTWASSIQGYAGDPAGGLSELEMDIYMGYSGSIGDLSTDIGILAYTYPGSDDTHYIEAYGSVGGAIEAVSWTLGAAYVWDQDNVGSQDNIYLYLDTSTAIGDTPFGLNTHIAYEDGAFGNDKWDWLVGLSYSYQQFSFSVNYVDTSNSGSNLGDATVVGMISASF